MAVDKPKVGKVFASSDGRAAGAEDALSDAALQGQKIIDRVGVAVAPSVGNAQEDAGLETWGEQFDAKLNELTARQDAFLKYLELQAHQA